jgi:hypothetical protein
MSISNDLDEILASVPAEPDDLPHMRAIILKGLGLTEEDMTRVAPQTPKATQVDYLKVICANTMKLADRLKLAEAALQSVSDNEVAEGYYPSVETMHALAEWEKARGQRFIFTDGVEHVIASGRGGLDNYLTEFGYDSDQESWQLVEPGTVIGIWCDETGTPGGVGDSDCALVETTATEWLELMEEDGLLCSTEQ